ncbi:MAG: hypothetical protein GXX96_35770 [Planctomycetaceae bacterium]|nr:hypothetical protein [Planctomycetaceae bacterium]
MTEEEPRIVNLSELTGRVDIEPDYHVDLPDTDQFVVVAGANYPAAATRYDHPNVAAMQDKVFHTRAYWPDGRKKWFQHAGRDFYFVIPRNKISLVFQKGYSYVPVVINGQTFRLSVTGGTFNGWTDFVGQKAHIGIDATVKVLNLLAEVAMPPVEIKSGTLLEIEALSQSDAAQFVELVAGHLCRSRLQEGHRLILHDGWSYDGSQGSFLVASKPKGRQFYIANNGHGAFRATYKAIDWTKTAAENGFVVEGPAQENRIGPITPCDTD